MNQTIDNMGTGRSLRFDPMHLLFAFIAGALAVPLFHQLVLMALVEAGVVQTGTYSMVPVPPFGVPRVVSTSFWGGVWGILFWLASCRWRIDAMYWAKAFAFGAILPPLVAIFIVAPLKGGLPPVAGSRATLLSVALLVNAAWGVGTALLLQGLLRLRGPGTNAAEAT